MIFFRRSPEEWRRRCKKKGEAVNKRYRGGRADERTQPPSASRAAERAATSARPAGPSEESCRNRCRREERMFRAKRASSPEELGLPVGVGAFFSIFRDLQSPVSGEKEVQALFFPPKKRNIWRISRLRRESMQGK